jgi:hypothetical protein
MGATVPNAYRPEVTEHLRNIPRGAHCDGRDMSTTARTPAQIRDLKLLCVGCPINKQCGQWAVGMSKREDVDEIAAGMTREERDQVRRELARRRLAKIDKTCTRCGTTKSGAEFYVRSGSLTSVESVCLDCRRPEQRQQAAARRARNRAAAARKAAKQAERRKPRTAKEVAA